MITLTHHLIYLSCFSQFNSFFPSKKKDPKYVVNFIYYDIDQILKVISDIFLLLCYQSKKEQF